MDDVRVAEAGVEDGRAFDPLERTIDRLDGIFARGVGTGLEVGLVDLNEIGAGGLEVAQLFVDGFRVGEGEASPVAVVVVLCLLRHRERARNGDLDAPIGDRPQELTSRTSTGAYGGSVP